MALRHPADASAHHRVGGPTGDRFAAQPDRARARRGQLQNALQGGGLADPVAAEQSDHLAGSNTKGNALQDMAFAVVGMDLVHFEQGHAAAPPVSPKYTLITLGSAWMSRGSPSARPSPRCRTVTRLPSAKTT